MESWELVFDIIDNSKFDVRYIGDCKLLKSDNKIIIQEAFTTIIDKDNNIIDLEHFFQLLKNMKELWILMLF